MTGSWQRTFNATNHYNAAIFLYQNTYNTCVGVINGFWPWSGVGCGGVSATGECYGTACSGCDRAAAQVVNEFSVQTAGTEDGWTDWSVFNQLLGEAKTNFQPTGWWWGYTTNSGTYNNNPGGNWTPRVPDNIYASAATKGHAVVTGNVAAGYWTSTTTCVYCAAAGTTTGSASQCCSGYCSYYPYGSGGPCICG